MDSLGTNLGYLLVQLLNFTIILGWPLLSLIALFALRRRTLTPVAQAIWALIILAVPFLGAIAFWIVKPSDR